MSNRSLLSFSRSFTFKNTSKTDLREESPKIHLEGAWSRLAAHLVKHNSWSRIGLLGATLTSLPEDVIKLFDDLERDYGFGIDSESRLSFFKDFRRATLGGSMLHMKRVEELLLKKKPEIEHFVGHNELQTLMRAKLEQGTSGNNDELKEFFDFDQFASLLFDVIKIQHDYERAHIYDKWMFHELKDYFPIEPESTPKQLWDLLCMIILLYCSFSVPLSIAFPVESSSSSFSIQDSIELTFDCIFMLDIVLSFLTAYDNQVPSIPIRLTSSHPPLLPCIPS
jgi:hypothetical protein